MNRKKKIAFFKVGNFSHTNARVFQILTDKFSDYQIDVIDIFSDLKCHRNLGVAYYCLKEYFLEILAGKKSVSKCYLRTQYAFDLIRKRILKVSIKQGYTFTFQTQSLFDANIPGVPHFVYTDHTHLANLQYPGFSSKSLFSKSWIDCEKSIFHNATINFTMSSNISRSIIYDYSCSPEKVACVYCGANLQVSKNELFDEKRYRAKNILFVGVDWERKGGPMLVKAFEKVQNTFPEATLIIVGCQPKIRVKNCFVVGEISLLEVKKYYEDATVFCLPSMVEPFGIVFLEAMANRLPVIGTEIGAIQDFIHEGENGYKVPPHNSDILAEKIIELFRNPKKCKIFGANGHKILWDKYTWPNTATKIYDKIAETINIECL